MRFCLVLALLLTASGVRADEHWAFQPLARPTLPAVRATAWPRSPVDRFLLARLEREQLDPAPAADRRTLIRRVTFDLIGLPPTPAEIDAFVNDAAPDAYERLVDRLLASPHFGERWARHWLDVVRFAESDGFETNQPRPNAWRYRDYVIDALNADLPYNRFMAEQLAGDRLGTEAGAATGFLVAGPVDRVKSPDPTLTLQQRADELHDMVSTVGSAFLGLTVGCARCHRHKFDPVSQSDYFGLAALLAGVQHGERPVGGGTPDLALVARLRRESADLERALSDAEPLAEPNGPPGRRAAVTATRNVDRFAPVLAKFVRFTVLATNNIEPCLDEVEIFAAGPDARNVARSAKLTSSGDYAGSPLHKLEHLNDGEYGNGRSWISNTVGRGWVQLEWTEPTRIDRVAWARDREGKYADRLALQYRIETALEPGQWRLVASSADRAAFGQPATDTATAQQVARRALLEARLKEAQRPAVAYAGTFAMPPTTYRLYRGDPQQPREKIAPAVPAEIAPALALPDDLAEADRRLALARWLGDRKNPLPARVLVNRLWHYHFGTGLVPTPSDFGKNGAAPTHPALLDWLASELIAHGWRMKPIHRLLVTSAAYRQSSRATPAGLTRDADARLLWRFPPRRLEAEPLRDAILATSGKLDLRMGGPGFDLFEPNTNYVRVYTPLKEFGPAQWRRLVYQRKPRMHLDDTFGAFDCPDGGQIAPRRTRSTTALQALNLLNSPFVLQQASFFAARLEAEAAPEARVRLAFRLAFGRDPAAAERDAAKALVREHGLPALCRALFNANEFLTVE